MDASNLRRPAPDGARLRTTAGRMRLLRSFDPGLADDDPLGGEVPDPYGGEPGEYARAFELIHAAAGLAGRLAELAGTRSRRPVSGHTQGRSPSGWPGWPAPG